jgi:hypothetical protein
VPVSWANHGGNRTRPQIDETEFIDVLGSIRFQGTQKYATKKTPQEKKRKTSITATHAQRETLSDILAGAGSWQLNFQEGFMAVLMSLGGNSAGDGFLVAPLGTNYDAELALQTDAGTATVTLQASPNPANLVFSTTGSISLSTTPTVVKVHAQLQSASRGDTTIQVLEGTTVVASFKVTSIKDPVVNFQRAVPSAIATDSDLPYINPIYTDTATQSATNDVVPLSQGWTFGLEGSRISCPLPALCPRSST